VIKIVTVSTPAPPMYTSSAFRRTRAASIYRMSGAELVAIVLHRG
jgi:hypothetical protein